MRRARQGEGGFTLIEALVALLVIAVAAAGIIRATEAHVDSIRELELRATAQWVAENRLVELGLHDDGSTHLPDLEEMLGQKWRLTTVLTPSDDPDLKLATVAVRKSGGSGPIVTLRGFVDAGTVTR